MNKGAIQFLGYKITDIGINIADDFGSKQETISHDINISTVFSDKDKDFVEVILDINVKSETDKLKVFVKIKGGFKRSNNVDDELFKLLASQNGPAILFPFARSIITSYTAQANISPIILPTVNFVKNK